ANRYPRCLSAGIVEVCTRSPTNANPSDDLTADLDRESAPEHQHLIVHLTKSLQGRHPVDQLSQLGRRTAETSRGIGLLPATIDRMRTGPIGSGHGAKHAGSI